MNKVKAIKALLVLDTNYLCHRAKHAFADLSYGESATGVIYGVLKDIIALRQRFNPTHTVFCFDSKYSLRQQVYAPYKAKRITERQEYDAEQLVFETDFRKQIQMLRLNYLPLIGFKNIFQQKGYESDDIMASVAKHITKNDVAIIVTADHDLFQVIDHNVFVFDPRQHKQTTLQTLKQEKGVLPDGWVSVKCLAGCKSDNIAGITGVGEKTAVKYVNGQLKVGTRLWDKIESKEGKEIFERNYPLIKLPYKGTKKFKLQRDEISDNGWKAVCELLGFKSLNKTLLNKRKVKKGLFNLDTDDAYAEVVESKHGDCGNREY